MVILGGFERQQKNPFKIVKAAGIQNRSKNTKNLVFWLEYLVLKKLCIKRDHVEQREYYCYTIFFK